MKLLAFSKQLKPPVHWLLAWWLMFALLVGDLTPAALGQSAVGLPQQSIGTAGTSLPYDAWIATGREDANLNDVAILSEDRLVAVGDRGQIVGSDSSGRNWQSLESPTTANLYGIRFLPSGTGLVVGGWIGANTRSSHAVLLRSEDEGRSWQAVPVPTLPRLTGLRIEANFCLAWGDYSPQWQTSVFESRDGGRTWQGAKIGNSNNVVHQSERPISLSHATAGAIASGGEFGAVDGLGRACFANSNVALRGVRQSTISEPWRPIEVLHQTGTNWLAGGSQGELLTSQDGEQWSNVAVPLTSAAQSLCRWQAITQFGASVWVGGQPGSILLHSPDRGKTWQVRHTGQSLPLSAIQFIDSNRGWATGPLGLVLATRDGGLTWYAQRQRAQRLGLMAVGRSVSDIPWGPLAAAAWDEQVAVSAAIYSKSEPIEQADFLPSQSALYRNLAPQVGLACVQVYEAYGNRESESQAGAPTNSKIEEELAFELRCWRPDVVLLGAAEANDALASQTLEIVALAAIKRSAASDAVLDGELDLPPWNATKLSSVCASERSQYSEQFTRLLRAPGIAVWDCLLPLPLRDRSAAHATSMRTIWTQSQAKSAFTELLGAIPLTHEIARQVNIPNVGNYQLVMGRVHRDNSIAQLVRSSLHTQTLSQWISDLDFIMRTVPAREQAAMLQRLAQQLNVSSQWPQRQIVYERILATSPQDDVADWARLEWLQFESSDECKAWRKVETVSPNGVQIAMHSKKPIPVLGEQSENGTSQAGMKEDRAHADVWNASPFGEVQLALDSPTHVQSMVVPASVALPTPDLMAMSGEQGVPQVTVRSQGSSVPGVSDSDLFDAQSSELATLGPLTPQARTAQVSWKQVLNETYQRSPVLLARPDLELWQFRNSRSIPSAQVAMDQGLNHLERVIDAQQLIGWPQMAEQERLFLSGHTDSLRWTSRAVRTDHPPLLDGEFSEVFWQSAAPMELTDFESRLPATQIRWAYDDKYVYIGIVSPCGSSSQMPPAVTNREYDADLRGVDQVQITIDTDRDYCTAIELAIAADGRTYDRCCGFAEYNPKWHVSTGVQSGYWTAELAVELDDLTTQTEFAGSAWAVSARRIQPDGVKQSWSRLRSHNPYLQASGLLLFERQSTGD